MKKAAISEFSTSRTSKGSLGPVRELSTTAALIVCVFLIFLHFALLAGSLSDYRITIDSAYHVALARQFGEHWLVRWDSINFGPGGRPNLQGPFEHLLVGAVGRLLGGTGNNYVQANALLALVQWTAAVLTVFYFSLRLRGVWAALLAVSLFTGAAFTSTSYSIGIPSGWLFLFSTWTAWYLVEGRTAAAAICGTLGIYSHIAGFAMIPVAIALAAILTARYKELITVGVVVAALTAPYALQVMLHVQWLAGAQSHSAILFDPLLDGLGIFATIVVIRGPVTRPFLVASLIAPAVWLIHDPGRLILQWGLPASVASGVVLDTVFRRFWAGRHLAALSYSVAVIATVLPLGVPALAPEVVWLAGFRYPRSVDWKESRTIATVLVAGGQSHRLIADYQPALCPALAVFSDITCQKGHWIEVQPRYDPADDMPVNSKTYVLPIVQTDEVLKQLSKFKWLTVYGGTTRATIVSIAPNLPAAKVVPTVLKVIHSEAQWLSQNTIPNTIKMDDLVDWMRGNYPRSVRALAAQREHAGRFELACLLLADATYTTDKTKSFELRDAARGFGVIASFLSDGFAVDYLNGARIDRFRRGAAALSNLTAVDDHDSVIPERVVAQLSAVVNETLEKAGTTFCERPSGNLMPWLKS